MTGAVAGACVPGTAVLRAGVALSAVRVSGVGVARDFVDCASASDREATEREQQNLGNHVLRTSKSQAAAGIPEMRWKGGAGASMAVAVGTG